MQRLRHIIAVLLAVAAFGLVGAVAAQAEAYKYATHAEVCGGCNHFGPYQGALYGASAVPYGHAIACGGIRGVFLTCAKNEGETGGSLLGFYVSGEPYIHNHATYTSYFDGWYFA